MFCRVLTVLLCLTVFRVFGFEPLLQFNVDLSKPPATRWCGAVEMVVAKKGWNYTFGPVFHFYQQVLWNSILSTTYGQLESMLKLATPIQYQELTCIAKGFANVGHPEVNVTVLSAWAYFYEMAHATEFNTSSIFYSSTRQGQQQQQPFGGEQSRPRRPIGCSGILALPVDKTKPMVHGRNLDLNPYSLRNFTMIVNFSSSSNYQDLLWQGIGPFWFVTSFLTSTRVGGISANGDWKTEDGTYPLSMIMARIKLHGGFPLMFYFRKFQDEKYSLNQAIVSLTSFKVPAPFYMILSGPGRQGAVVTTRWALPPVVIYLNDSTPYWFLVQTNDDHWKPDEPEDPRRTVAENTLKFLGRDAGATKLGMWMTLSQFPVHNGGTAFSALMSAVEPVFAYARMVVMPVFPWYPPSIPNTTNRMF